MFFIVKATKHVESDIGEFLAFVFCHAKKIKAFAHFRLEQGRGWLSAFHKEQKFRFADKYVSKVHLLQFVLANHQCKEDIQDYVPEAI